MNQVRSTLTVLIACAVACAGCSNSDDSKYASFRKQFLVTDQPTAPSTIEGAIAGLETQSEVTILGRIYAGSSEPFEPNLATMVLSEAPDPAHDHDPGDCPFCKKRLENAKSCIVRFLDKDGNVLKQGAEKLLGVAKNQDVVVKGHGVLLPGVDIFQVDAVAIFLRPLEKKK